MAKKALNERRGLISYLLPFAFCLLPSLAFSQEILVSTPIHSQYYGASLPLFRLKPGGGQTGNEQEWLNQAGVVTTYVDSNGVLHALNGGGISSINGLVSFAQFLVVCSNGTDFNIQDSIDTHSLCIPDASATARGLVTTGSQVLGGNKTFLGDITANSFTSTSPITANFISEMDCSTVTPTAGLDIICADQTAHAIQFSNNGGAFGSIPTGFPRLDQILDPLFDKAFTMGGRTITFGGVTQLNAGPQSGFLAGSDAEYYQSIATHSFTNLNLSTANQVSSSEAGGLVSIFQSNDTSVQTLEAIVGVAETTDNSNLDAFGIRIVSATGVNTNGGSPSGASIVSKSLGGAPDRIRGVHALVQALGNSAIGTEITAINIQVGIAGTASSPLAKGINIFDVQGATNNYSIKAGLAPFGGFFSGDRGTFKSNAAAVQPVTFTGIGLNDATSGGTYTGLDDLAYCVQIDASVPSPDTFEWGTGGSCSNGATGVSMTAGAHALSNGVTITFAATDGHTIGDNWIFTAYAPIPLTLQDHNGNITAKVRETGDVLGRRFIASTGTALVAGDFVASGGWGATGSVAVTSASSDQSFHITVTGAGGGYGLNPTVAFTFKDGTFGVVPIYDCSMETGGTGALSFFTPDNSSATVLTLTYAGTPGAATYKIACNAWGH